MSTNNQATRTKVREQVSPADLEGLIGTVPAPQRVAVLPAWSRAAAASAAASLANTGGGMVIVGAAVDADGSVRAFTGGGASERELLSVADDLGPAGRHLLTAAVVEVAGAKVGVISVAECTAPPVLVETEGAIYRRTEAGLARLLTRADLDLLVSKDRTLRERGETNLEAMVRRNLFGHLNFLTIAVTIAPRATGAGPYTWAKANGAALVDHAHGFAQRWALEPGHVTASAGEILVARPEEVTGFIRVSRNGTVAAGEHLRRPPSAQFLPAAELASRLSEMAEMAALPLRGSGAGLALGALALEGVRDLQLGVEGGLTAPASKDTLTTLVPERYLEDMSEFERFRADVLSAAGAVFSADLVRGAGALYGGPDADSSLDPRQWHGQTKRTERRVSGARGHGSAR